MPVSTIACPICGTPAGGRYCEQCGAAVVPRSCDACHAPLSPAARFCHRCGVAVRGAPVPQGGPEARSRGGRAPWLIAGLLIIVLLGWIALKGINRNAPGAVPDMANAGNSAPDGAPPANAGAATPPDIGSMSPEERFNRLFDRVMRAASTGDTAGARQFLPMALMAYGMLDSVNADLRYHAAILQAEGGNYDAALALADTILATAPGHLFGYLTRAEVADRQGNAARAAAARKAFNAAVDRELARTDRPEYRDHRAVIDAYRAGQ